MSLFAKILVIFFFINNCSFSSVPLPSVAIKNPLYSNKKLLNFFEFRRNQFLNSWAAGTCSKKLDKKSLMENGSEISSVSNWLMGPVVFRRRWQLKFVVEFVVIFESNSMDQTLPLEDWLVWKRKQTKNIRLQKWYCLFSYWNLAFKGWGKFEKESVDLWLEECDFKLVKKCVKRSSKKWM